MINGKYNPSIDPNNGMFLCAKNGLKDGIEFYINHGANQWNYALNGAISSGYIDLVEFFIDHGANNLHDAMRLAINTNNIDIIDLLIKRGFEDYNMALEEAATNNNKCLVDLFIKYGATDYNIGLCGAAEYNNLELVKFFVEKGANCWYGYTSLNKHVRGYQQTEKFLREKIQSTVTIYQGKNPCELCNDQNNYGQEHVVINECYHVFHRVCLLRYHNNHLDNIICPTCFKNHLGYQLDY